MEQELPPIVKKYISDVAQKYSKKPIQVKPKSSSKLMKAVGWFFKVTKISPAFMTDYFTTIGNTIYYPDDALTSMDTASFLEVITHECIHVKDYNRFGLLFGFLYLSPQILAALSALSLIAIFTSKLWLLWLIALLCLAPLPAYGRYYFERRAYRISFIYEKYLYGNTDFSNVRAFIVSQMATSFYYFTWPFPKWIDSDLKDEKFIETAEYQEIASFIKANFNP